MIPGGLTNTRLVAMVTMALYHKNPGCRFAVQHRGKDAYFINVSTKEYIGDVDLKEMGIKCSGSILYQPEPIDRLEGGIVVTHSYVRKPLSIIVATDENNGIGKNNTLPWRVPTDMKNFAKVTAGKVVIMGRKTFESLPPRGLPGRTMIVVSNSLKYQPGQGFKLVASLKEAIALAEFISDEEYFVIGGARMFEEAIKYAKKVYLTQVKGDFQCDVKWDGAAAMFPDTNLSAVSTSHIDPAVEGLHGELHSVQWVLTRN